MVLTWSQQQTSPALQGWPAQNTSYAGPPELEDAAVLAAVEAAVLAAVDAAVLAAVEAAVLAAVDAAALAAVDAAVLAAVDAAVLAAVDAAVLAAVDAAVLAAVEVAAEVPPDPPEPSPVCPKRDSERSTLAQAAMPSRLSTQAWGRKERMPCL
jgi:hypothetical protein